MNVWDKFLNVMHVYDDEDEDDFLDEESGDFDLDDSRPGRRILGRGEDADEVLQPVRTGSSRPPAQAQKKERRSFFSSKAASKGSPSRRREAEEEWTGHSPKVSSFRPRRPLQEEEETNNYSVCVIRPKSMENALEIAKTLVSGCVVILNLEGLDLDVSQRLFDFASGSCCALQGRLDKISNYIFVLTPRGIDISGEFQEILTGTFDPEDLMEEDE